jgi:hypothetical protein
LEAIFSDFLLQEAENGKLASIDKVLKEIKRGNDDLKKWSEEKFLSYFLSTKEKKVIEKYQELMQWAEEQFELGNYTENAKIEFMQEDNADAWLIAFAMAKNGFTIVTFEKKNKYIKSKIPIPNVCDDFQIEYCDLFEMLEKLKFQL